VLPAAPFPGTIATFSAEVGHGAGPDDVGVGVGEAVGVGVGVAVLGDGVPTAVTDAFAAGSMAWPPLELQAADATAMPPSAAAAAIRWRWRWTDVIAVPPVVTGNDPDT
jgi:hypothetical protein